MDWRNKLTRYLNVDPTLSSKDRNYIRSFLDTIPSLIKVASDIKTNAFQNFKDEKFRWVDINLLFRLEVILDDLPDIEADATEDNETSLLDFLRFAHGFQGKVPSYNAIQTSALVVEAIIEESDSYNIAFDDLDGSLSFGFRMDGNLIIGNVFQTDELRVNVYDDTIVSSNVDDMWIKRISSFDEFKELFQESNVSADSYNSLELIMDSKRQAIHDYLSNADTDVVFELYDVLDNMSSYKLSDGS